MKHCKSCKEEFEPSVKQQVFCSKVCNKHFHNVTPKAVATKRQYISDNEMRKAYINQKYHANRRDIIFKLSLSEWQLIWMLYWGNRGPLGDQFCMSRLYDANGYTLGNVKIITNSENISQGHEFRKAETMAKDYMVR